MLDFTGDGLAEEFDGQAIADSVWVVWEELLLVATGGFCVHLSQMHAVFMKL